MEVVESKYKKLVKVLNSPNCTIDDIRLILNWQPITQVQNDAISGDSPISIAIYRNLSLDIVKELINHGFDVNQRWGYFTPLRFAVRTMSDTQNRTSIVKFLLENGAEVKGSVLRDYLHICRNWGYDHFLPILKLLLFHTDKITKCNLLDMLFQQALKYIICRYRYNELEEFSINNAIKAIKILIRSGAHPKVDMFNRIFNINRCFMDNHLKYRSELASSYVKQLCELPIEYIILKDFKRGDFMKRYEQTVKLEQRGSRKICCFDKLQSLYNDIKKMWEIPLAKREKMMRNILKNNISLWNAIDYLCGINPGISNAIIYDIMHQLSQDENAQFRSIVCYTAKNMEWMSFYRYVWSMKQHTGNVHLAHPDCFHQISEYLSNEDIFNYLLAICYNRI